MEKETEKYWEKIAIFFKDEFHMEPEIHNILFMIGVQELGYGFQQLDKDTKTKVINFATIFISKYIEEQDRQHVKDQIEKGIIRPEDTEDEIYRLAILKYFKEKEII